jgi:hypothetical protein
VCVRRLRVSEIYLLDQQRDACPRLKREDLRTKRQAPTRRR